MIPFTCPCCEVSHPPHRDGCDFHNDCPTDAEVFDEVSALRSEVARLREERRWIPVTERLPELEQHVLVFCQHVPGRGGSWVGMHVAYRGRDGLWMEPAEPCDVSVVTHWLPLPPPPGEGEVEG